MWSGADWLSAMGGKAKRITVIMPMLYEGRQHKRQARESLDCAMALQELVNMGVTNAPVSFVVMLLFIYVSISLSFFTVTYIVAKRKEVS